MTWVTNKHRSDWGSRPVFPIPHTLQVPEVTDLLLVMPQSHCALSSHFLLPFQSLDFEHFMSVKLIFVSISAFSVIALTYTTTLLTNQTFLLYLLFISPMTFY